MDKNIAQGLGPLVNTVRYYEPLKDYVKSRIEYYKIQLTVATTMDDVKKYQGAIYELNQFLGLKERAEQVLKISEDR